MALSVKRNDFIYLWSILFLGVVFLFTKVISYDGGLLYLLYFLFAIPFYKHIDKLAVLCFVLSTLPDYFVGASAGIWSFYSVFLLISLINFITTNTQMDIKGMLPFVLLIIAIWLSYLHSPFQYIMGAYSLSYTIVVSAVVAMFVRLKNDTLSNYIPMCACVVIIFYVVVLLTNGTGINFTTTISDGINHNAFGRSLAQLSTILTVKVLVSNKRSVIYSIIWLLSIVLTFITGSRNAFLSLAVAVLFIFAYKQKKSGHSLSGAIKLLVVFAGVLVLADLILPDLGFNLSRYNYVEVISSGGTNRTAIWRLLIPEIIRNYMAFGFGPSYYCSSRIVQSLMNRPYTNTHNIILEAWGELGIFGVFPFLWIIIAGVKKIIEKTRANFNYLVIFAVLFDVLVNGIGEAMFAGINLWLVIGFCYSNVSLYEGDRRF